MDTRMHRLSDQAFQRISTLMHDSIGLSFPEHKKALVSARLATRLQRLALAGFDDYADLLDDPGAGAEFQMAVDLLTTHETYFFREPRHFELLQEHLRAGPARQTGQGPSLWSAAASFGDEAYSLAMLLSEMQAGGTCAAGWSVLATDISERVLGAARTAIYPVERLRFVSPERLRRHCLRGEGPAEGQVLMKPALRERVQFAQLNLCRPFAGLGPFDAVFLRNVLIYFDAPTKEAVVERTLATLRPGGLFFVGSAEGRLARQDSLQVLAPGVFRKRP